MGGAFSHLPYHRQNEAALKHPACVLFAKEGEGEGERERERERERSWTDMAR